MPNPKLSTLQDAFTDSSINLTRWNSNAGSPTLDAVNDLVVVPQPTVNGTINMLGSTALYDATASSIYAEVGPAANGNGGTRTELKLQLDSNNLVTMRLAAGVFGMALKTAGTTVVTAFTVAYDPNAHGWWRIREASGVFYMDASADAYTWANVGSTAYSWSAAAVTFAFQVAAQTTEVAGNVATIQHVNTMAGGPFNINWPLLEEAWGPIWNCNAGTIPLDRYVELTPRTEGQSSSSRGKQYELDQTQSGTTSIVLANKDGALDPDNASGPYAGRIQPAQPYRKRAQWPPTRNLLTQVQATGGDLGGQPLGAISQSTSGPSIYSQSDASLSGTFVASASAWSGGTVMQFSVPSGTVSGVLVAYTAQPAVAPGVAYSQVVWVRDVTASTSLQVKAALTWINASNATISTTYGGTSTLTGTTTAGWTQLTVTGTAPANAAAMSVGVAVAATAGATCSVQVDGWQLEKAATPSTWTCPGVWNAWVTGFTDAWDADWSMGGTYGTVTPTTYDSFALLSQKKLLDALTEEINLRSPRFLYTLSDPAGSTVAADTTGNYPAASLASSKYGAGSFVFGSSIAATASSGTYTGSTGTVVSVDNANPGAATFGAATFLSLVTAGISGPGSTAWTRMIAFRNRGPNPPASAATLWSANDRNPAGGSLFLMNLQSTGVVASLAGPTSGAAIVSFGTSAVLDGNWHLAFVGYDGVDKVVTSVDGVTSTGTGYGPTFNPTGCASDAVAADANNYTGNASIQNYKGDISFVAEFPTLLGSADCTAIYAAWKSACTGDSSNTRYARVLTYAGYTGQQSLQSGLTTSMGAASFAGQDALSALQAVVETENGAHFVARDGTVTFQARSARYNSTVPTYVFGERTDLGEWPYEDAKPSRDTTHLANDVEVTQTASGQVFPASSTTAQTNYFPKTLTRNINSTSDTECQDAASYLLSRYVNPVTRVQKLLLHPSANPAMWPVCLSLELGMRVRVMRRPPSPAPAIQVDCFVEKIDTSNDDGAEAWWTLQCSPVDITPYGTFAAFHTTLNGTISSGVGSITINNGADNTNPCAGQIGGGQQLVLGLGTANQETVTVASVATTTAGWTTCVITLTANTTKGHTAGDVVCEPLPAGVTSATTWDTVSVLDAVAFAY